MNFIRHLKKPKTRYGIIRVAAQLLEISKKNLNFLFLGILASVFFCISSCRLDKQDIKFDNYTIFVLLSPTDTEQLRLSYELLDQIKKNLIFNGTRYEIHGICNYIQNIESLDYSKRNKSIVTNSAFTWLNDIREKKSKKCDNDLDELSSFINTVDDSLELRKKRKMIIISQIPWQGINANEELIGALKNEVNSIENKDRIKGIYIFGVSNTSQKIIDIFASIRNDSSLVEARSKDIHVLEAMVLDAKELITSSK